MIPLVVSRFVTNIEKILSEDHDLIVRSLKFEGLIHVYDVNTLNSLSILCRKGSDDSIYCNCLFDVPYLYSSISQSVRDEETLNDFVRGVRKGVTVAREARKSLQKS